MKNDMISRQAAIETVRKAQSIGQVHRMLLQLPPAQPECEDAVSRFEVLRLIDYSSNDLNDSVDNWYFQGKVKELPSVTPKQPGWIPCSTELPKDGEEVIVSIHDDSGDYAYDYTSSGWYAAAGEFWVVDNEVNMRVVAWMPLPKPYREGGQG